MNETASPRRAGVALALSLLLSAGAAGAQTSAPYAGQEARGIASLSDADIAALLDGAGWGFAKPAELNGWPGPAHVLDMADALELTETQRVRIAAIFTAMDVEARRLGAAYVAAERALDAAFAGDGPSTETLAALTAEASGLRGRLRAVHLAAHLATKPLLTRHQIMIYMQARGYAGGHGAGGHDGAAGHANH